MIDKFVNFFTSLILQDYIIIFLSILFLGLFFYIGLEKTYKSYLGVILGLFTFSFINLALFSLNDKDVGMNSIKTFLLEYRESIGLFGLILLPIFGILIPLKTDISFRISQDKKLSYISLFLFGICYFGFILTTFLSIIHNKFFFKIDNSLIVHLSKNELIIGFLGYFANSKIFIFFSKYDNIINLFFTLFVFYKMTIGSFVDYILYKFFNLLSYIFETNSKKSYKKDSHQNHEENHHEEHGHHEEQEHHEEHHDDHEEEHHHGHH